MANYYYEQRLTAMCGSQLAEMVFHWVLDAATLPDHFAICTQLNAQWNVGGGTAPLFLLRSIMSDACFISGIRARPVAPVGGNTILTIFRQDDFPGLLTGSITPQQVAACVIWVNSVTPDRTGRNFIYGIPKDVIESNRFEDSYQTAVIAWADRMRGGLTVTGGTANLCTYDRATKTGPIVEDCYLSLKVGTQKRREVSV